jgi:hypothetical protein
MDDGVRMRSSNFITDIEKGKAIVKQLNENGVQNVRRLTIEIWVKEFTSLVTQDNEGDFTAHTW